MKTKLYKHQQRVVSNAPNQYGLWHKTGTGKTLTLLGLIERDLSNFPTPQIALVVCPKGVKIKWQREVITHLPQYEKQIKVITKEEFRRDWAMLAGAAVLAVDEAHHFFGIKSTMGTNLIKYIEKFKPASVYLATATPFRSSPWDVYQCLRILGRPMSYPAFRERFFYEIEMRGRNVYKPRAGIQSELMGLLHLVGNTVTMEDCVDVPEQSDEFETYTESTQQRVARASLPVDTPITYWTKCHQICGGTIKGDEFTDDRYVGSPKEDRIQELSLEFPKLIVVCRYRSELELLRSRCTIPSGIINGSLSADERQAVLDEAEASEEYVLFVAAQCSEGYELPSFPVMVFYSLDFSFVHYQQMRGRIHRINHLKKNLYIHLLIEDSVDMAVLKALQNKQSFDATLYSQE